jgi:hypothetical protein
LTRGHLSYPRLKLLNLSIPQILCNSIPCTICPLARQKILSFPISSSLSNAIFYLIHCVIWGPFFANSINGCHYFLTIVDDYSRYTWIHLMKSKDQTRSYIQSFFYLIESQFNSKIKFLRSDDGSKFNMADLFSNKCVIY